MRISCSVYPSIQFIEWNVFAEVQSSVESGLIWQRFVKLLPDSLANWVILHKRWLDVNEDETMHGIFRITNTNNAVTKQLNQEK